MNHLLRMKPQTHWKDGLVHLSAHLFSLNTDVHSPSVYSRIKQIVENQCFFAEAKKVFGKC